MCPRDISRYIEAYQNKEKAKWERARLVSYMAVSPYLDKKKEMTDVIPFIWDEKREVKPTREPTKEELEWLKIKETHR